MSTNLSARNVGSFAGIAISEAKSGAIGEVVSVFTNSLYIKTTNQELIFISSRETKSPITINVESNANMQQIIKPLATVSLHENRIDIGESVSIDLTRVVPWDLETVARPQDFRELKEKLHLGSLILMIVDNRLSVLDQNGFTHSSAMQWVKEGVLPLRHSDDAEGFRIAAQDLVGLGSGFTPSGDDLLGGFLAAYNSFSRRAWRKTICIQFDTLEKKTNWISAKLLDFMQREVLDEQMSMLIESTNAHGSDRFILALETLLPRGHTSGIDILVGVLLALGLLHDIAEGDDITATLVRRLRLTSEDSLSQVR